MTPQPIQTDPNMLNIRYVLADDPVGRICYLGLPKWIDNRLLSPTTDQFRAWWKQIKESGGTKLPEGQKVKSIELLEGGYFNAAPSQNGRGQTVMKVLAKQVCDGRVIASYGLGFPETDFEWLHEPEPAPEFISSDLPQVNDS